MFTTSYKESHQIKNINTSNSCGLRVQLPMKSRTLDFGASLICIYRILNPHRNAAEWKKGE